MTRNEEDQILMEEGRLLQQGGKKRGPKRKTHVYVKDIRAAIPVDRRSLSDRLSYGYSLMAEGGDAVYE